MAAHPVVVKSLARRFSKVQLEADAVLINEMLMNPDPATVRSLEGVTIQRQIRSREDLIAALEEVEAAIEMLELQESGTPEVQSPRTHFLDFSQRPVE